MPPALGLSSGFLLNRPRTRLVWRSIKSRFVPAQEMLGGRIKAVPAVSMSPTMQYLNSESDSHRVGLPV
jgi:hypothetical protein